MSSNVPSTRNTAKVNKVEEDAHKSNTNQDDEEEEEEEEEEKPTLRSQFTVFVKYRDEQNPGTHILLSQSDFWMKHAGVIKGRSLTTTDTGVCYFKQMKYKLDYDEYLDFLQTLADYKKIQLNEIVDKLTFCGSPPHEMMAIPPQSHRGN